MYTSKQSDGIFTEGENDGGDDVGELTASLKIPSTELTRRHQGLAHGQRPQQAQFSWRRHRFSGPVCSCCS